MMYAGIGVGAGGVVLVVVGGVLVALGNSAFNTLNSPSKNYTFDPSVQDTMNTDRGAGYALLGVGAAAVAGGVVLAVLGWRAGKNANRASLSPILGPGHAGASLAFRF